MEYSQFFGIVKDIILSIAAVITACVAYTGLNKWKKELRGKIDFDTAHALIKATYKVRDELKYARFPSILPHEFPEGYDDSFMTKNPKEKGDAYAFIYSNRMKHVFDVTQDFDICALEAEALWGKQIKEYTQELRMCYRQLNVSFEAYIRNKYSGNVTFESDQNFKEKIEQDIEVSLEEDDLLSIRIKDAIKKIEQEIRPYLDKK